MKLTDAVGRIPTNDRSRLPVWAREYLELLETRLAEALEREENAARSQDPTDTWVSGGGVNEDHGLQPGSRIHFRPGSGPMARSGGKLREAYLEAFVSREGALVVRTDGDQLAITPKVQNRVEIRVVADGGR